MGERSVLFSAANGVGVITLNRPQARNAIDPGFTENLHEAVQRCAADPRADEASRPSAFAKLAALRKE